MLGPCLAPKRRKMSSLGDVIPGRCNPWEVPSSGDVTARPTARLSGPDAVPAHPGDTSKVQACPGAVVTSWVSATLPAPLDFLGGWRVCAGFGELQQCCFGIESRDFLDAPRRVALVPKTHTLCLSQAEVGGSQGIPKLLPQPVLGSGNSTGGDPSSR